MRLSRLHWICVIAVFIGIGSAVAVSRGQTSSQGCMQCVTSISCGQSTIDAQEVYCHNGGTGTCGPLCISAANKQMCAVGTAFDHCDMNMGALQECGLMEQGTCIGGSCRNHVPVKDAAGNQKSCFWPRCTNPI
jgi:hypothetical protein